MRGTSSTSFYSKWIKFFPNCDDYLFVFFFLFFALDARGRASFQDNKDKAIKIGMNREFFWKNQRGIVKKKLEKLRSIAR